VSFPCLQIHPSLFPPYSLPLPSISSLTLLCSSPPSHVTSPCCRRYSPSSCTSTDSTCLSARSVSAEIFRASSTSICSVLRTKDLTNTSSVILYPLRKACACPHRLMCRNCAIMGLCCQACRSALAGREHCATAASSTACSQSC
jgi:hypothetical protein